MVQSVYSQYLDNLARELDFFPTFYALLLEMGFHDVHCTHGTLELGRDFIAKLSRNGVNEQWSFQLKRGDISVSTWRKDIQSQLLTCAYAPLSHPNYDDSLISRTALVITGSMNEYALNEMSQFQTRLKGLMPSCELQLWQRSNLVEEMIKTRYLVAEKTKSSGVHSNFLQLYGRIISGDVLLEDLEMHSRKWCNGEDGLDSAGNETAVLSQQAETSLGLYEAFYIEIAFLRSLCVRAFRPNETSRPNLDSLIQLQLDRLLTFCQSALGSINTIRSQGNDVFSTISRLPAQILVYPVVCMRYAEMMSFGAILSADPEAQSNFASGLSWLITSDEGSCHPVSDRYAISVILTTLVLFSSGHTELARKFVNNVIVFLCDRYSDGYGLSTVDESTQDEVERLLGYPFEHLDLKPEYGSLLVTGLLDILAYFGEGQLYLNVLNDAQACEIVPQYWQCGDTESQFFLESDEVYHYASVEFSEEIASSFGTGYATHIAREPSSWILGHQFRYRIHAALSILLRDRYFPTAWKYAELAKTVPTDDGIR